MSKIYAHKKQRIFSKRVKLYVSLNNEKENDAKSISENEDISTNINNVSDEITFDARLENVSIATDFVSKIAHALPFSKKDKYQIDIAVDEIVSNVARYAYDGKIGSVSIKTESDTEGLTITVIDSGIPYNPIEKEDPDVTLSAEERVIGGYGIFIVKNVMDDIKYEYLEGKNILTMRKKYVIEL